MLWQITKWLIFIAIALLAFFALRQFLKPSVDTQQLIFATVQQGDLENTFSARGLVKPESEILLTSPLSTKIKSVLIEAGASLKKGNTILQLDTEFAALEYSKLKDELLVKENNVNRLELSLQKNIRDIELDNKIKQLEVKNLQAQVQDLIHLHHIGGATQEEVDQAKQNEEIARLQLQKLENELNYRNSSFKADVRNEELQSAIQEKVLNELGKKIALTQVKAPASGVLTWVNQAIGTQVEVGSPLAKIANLSSFTIEGTASDRFSENILIGLPVRIRVNREYINGQISQILPNIENNTVQFKVQLEQANSPLLKANMQVELFIVEDRNDNTLFVTKGSAYKGGKTQEFFVLEGDQLVKREVEIGITNMNNVEILSGLEAGDQIVINDNDQLRNKDIISLKTKEDE